MARILTPEQFRQCPKGTVFSHGPRFNFRGLLILDEIIPPNQNGQWGFWAIEPMYPDVRDWAEAAPLMEESLRTGVRFDCETSSTKSMSYDTGADGRDFEVFIVLDDADWRALNDLVAYGKDCPSVAA